MSYKNFDKLGRNEPIKATGFKDTKQWGETHLKQHSQCCRCAGIGRRGLCTASSVTACGNGMKDTNRTEVW